MELKNITCDLKYARMLKSFGVDQTKSYAVFYGAQLCGPVSFNSANQDLCGTISNRNRKDSQEYFIATFTTDELLELLPKDIKHGKNNFSSYYLCMGYDGEFELPMAWYEDNDLIGPDDMLVSKSDKKLANALAKVLIWMIQKGHIKFIEKEKKKKPLVIPTERIIYHKMPKRFYSFKLKTWILRTKPMIDGNWYRCDFINETTGEKIDDVADNSLAKLSKRVLGHINNPNMF